MIRQAPPRLDCVSKPGQGSCRLPRCQGLRRRRQACCGRRRSSALFGACGRYRAGNDAPAGAVISAARDRDGEERGGGRMAGGAGDPPSAAGRWGCCATIWEPETAVSAAGWTTAPSPETHGALCRARAGGTGNHHRLFVAPLRVECVIEPYSTLCCCGYGPSERNRLVPRHDTCPVPCTDDHMAEICLSSPRKAVVHPRQTARLAIFAVESCSGRSPIPAQRSQKKEIQHRCQSSRPRQGRLGESIDHTIPRQAQRDEKDGRERVTVGAKKPENSDNHDEQRNRIERSEGHKNGSAKAVRHGSPTLPLPPTYPDRLNPRTTRAIRLSRAKCRENRNRTTTASGRVRSSADDRDEHNRLADAFDTTAVPRPAGIQRRQRAAGGADSQVAVSGRHHLCA